VSPFQAPPPGAEDDAFDPELWRARLGQADLPKRLEAFDVAAAIARRDPEARRVIAHWAELGADPELAWTAMLLLREAERSRDPFADLFSRRPGSSLFPDLNPFGGRSTLDRSPLDDWDPFAGIDPFRGLAPVPFPQQGGTGRSESFRMEQTPEGVRVELRTEAEDGREEVKTYEAPTLEELLEQHPELREHTGGMSIRVGPADLPDASDLLERMGPKRMGIGAEDSELLLPGVLRRVPASTRTDILGIRMQEPGDWNTERPGVGADEGLLVFEVVPGTIAAGLGIEPGEVLVELNGRKVSRASDVASVLRDRRADQGVTAILVDEDGVRVTRRWMPRDV
jgi:hypothetical protein